MINKDKQSINENENFEPPNEINADNQMSQDSPGQDSVPGPGQDGAKRGQNKFHSRFIYVFQYIIFFESNSRIKTAFIIIFITLVFKSIKFYIFEFFSLLQEEITNI